MWWCLLHMHDSARGQKGKKKRPIRTRVFGKVGKDAVVQLDEVEPPLVQRVLLLVKQKRCHV